jgi:hypothetical protein
LREDYLPAPGEKIQAIESFEQNFRPAFFICQRLSFGSTNLSLGRVLVTIPKERVEVGAEINFM